MKINIKTTNLELTQAISDYLDNKLESLKKFKRYLGAEEENWLCNAEIGRATSHHRHGEVFRAEVQLFFANKHIYKQATAENLYAAIDQAKDEVVAELSSLSKKRETVLRRGGRAVKNMLRGISPWRRR
ncbi:MAG: ribosome-associated translation inhibitor RaiA [Patescibacteria group bacterium]|nr:ribosome-associated translation inhibitor RaiA [Patescibacteria group bacterium]